MAVKGDWRVVTRDIRPITARTALNRVKGMSFGWSLNPYRGCQHACVYCYARSTHQYLDLGPGDDFSRVLFFKENLPDVLEQELRRRRRLPDRVAVGTATDPYQPLEGRHRLTRRCLEVLARYRVPVEIITKGTLIRRDIDVLKRLAATAGATVCVSVPTVDAKLWRETEPGAPAPGHRLATVRMLREAGIRAGVLMAPILPGLSDRPDRVDATVRAAHAHGAAFVHADVVRLSRSVRPVFDQFLAEHYPELRPQYRRWFTGDAGVAPAALRGRALGQLARDGAGGMRVEASARPRQLGFEFG
jgi:DNA repair photolyase